MAAAPTLVSRALANVYLKAFNAIFFILFPVVSQERKGGSGFRDMFQFVAELLGRLWLGGFAPEYVEGTGGQAALKKGLILRTESVYRFHTVPY